MVHIILSVLFVVTYNFVANLFYTFRFLGDVDSGGEEQEIYSHIRPYPLPIPSVHHVHMSHSHSGQGKRIIGGSRKSQQPETPL